MLCYKRTFNLYQNEVKINWALIKETLQQKKKQELSTEFIWNDRIITDLNKIPNKFNTYFINIGQSLSEQIHATRSSDEYLSNRTHTIFNFTEVNKFISIQFNSIVYFRQKSIHMYIIILYKIKYNVYLLLNTDKKINIIYFNNI